MITSWYQHIILLREPFRIALHSLDPLLAHYPRTPCFTLWLRVLARIPPFPVPFHTHAGPCWSLSHPAQCLLAISSQTPQLASDKRESLVSLTVHLSPFLPTALWTLFSCSFHLRLVLETDHLASSSWLTLNPLESEFRSKESLFLLIFFSSLYFFFASLIWKRKLTY